MRLGRRRLLCVVAAASCTLTTAASYATWLLPPKHLRHCLPCALAVACRAPSLLLIRLMCSADQGEEAERRRNRDTQRERERGGREKKEEAAAGGK
jgi:hypothetical protein